MFVHDLPKAARATSVTIADGAALIGTGQKEARLVDYVKGIGYR